MILLLKPDIIPSHVFVFINESNKKVKESIYKFELYEGEFAELIDMPKDSLGIHDFCDYVNLSVIRINFKKGDSLAHRCAVITHECFHAVVKILNNMGVKFKMNVSEELYAYFLDYLVERVINEMLKSWK